MRSWGGRDPRRRPLFRFWFKQLLLSAAAIGLHVLRLNFMLCATGGARHRQRRCRCCSSLCSSLCRRGVLRCVIGVDEGASVGRGRPRGGKSICSITGVQFR